MRLPDIRLAPTHPAALLELPRAEGVYLWRSEVALYVGSALSLRRRCVDHLFGASHNPASEDLRTARPTELLVWIVASPERWALERVLWDELRPTLNRRPPCPKRPKGGAADYQRAGICSA